MPVRFISGDLFDLPVKALAHGCNCAGAMGKGIATEFRRRFPAMYKEYKSRCADGRFQLGGVFTWKEDSLTVFNLGTQRTWRTPAELPAVEQAVSKMIRLAEDAGIESIGLPRIGAGLGRLRWEDVRAAIERLAMGTSVELVVVEDFQGASSA
jgi:O-acetyl-ADP-ribose deacetylase (regulator of RNase III)